MGEGTPNAETPAQGWGRTNTAWLKVRKLAVVDAARKWVPFDLVSVTKGTIRGKASIVFHLAGDRAFSVDEGRSSIASQITRIGALPPAGKYVIEAVPSKNKANTSGYDLLLKAFDPNAPAVDDATMALIAKIAAIPDKAPE